MSRLTSWALRAAVALLGRERTRGLIPALADHAEVDLLLLAYNRMGILKYENDVVSGERFLATRVLKEELRDVPQPVMFDVGANVGKYSLLLAKEFPGARIYSFEPNRNTFAELVTNVDGSVRCVNVGMGAEERVETIFTYSDSLTSSHASMYSEVFEKFHKRNDVIPVEFQLTTIDLFCEREGLPGIDFLKIDTEGNELSVLKGAQRMLSEKRIGMVQFEFGECDVFARVFLRDFYDILSDFRLYRLDSEHLIPLFDYQSTNEIFRFQNFLAVRRDLPFGGSG